MNKNFKNILISLLGIFAVSVYPLVFLLSVNFDILPNKVEILIEMIKVFFGATMLFALILITLKDIKKALLSTLAITTIFLNGYMIEQLLSYVIPISRYWHNVLIILLISIIIIYLINKLSNENAGLISKIISLVFTILIMINIIPVLITQLTNQITSEDTQPDSTEIINQNEENNRNIYWLLFDMYGRNDILLEHYNYDNAEFTDYLETKGFNVSYTSSNETRHSPVVTANIANLDYVVAYSNERTLLEDYALVTEAQENAILIPLVESYGYDVVGIGYSYLYGHTGETVSSGGKGGYTNDGDDVISLFWKQTLLEPFVSISSTVLHEETLGQLQYLQNPENIPDSNTFVLMHVNSPHPPYLFNADGSLSETDVSVSTEAITTDPYIEQLIFINSQIEIMVDTIIENDPNALIAVVSDHGPKSGNFTTEEKVRVMASLYDGGEYVNIDGLTGINIMITMLNTALGTDIEFVPYQLFEEVIR